MCNLEYATQQTYHLKQNEKQRLSPTVGKEDSKKRTHSQRNTDWDSLNKKKKEIRWRQSQLESNHLNKPVHRFKRGAGEPAGKVMRNTRNSKRTNNKTAEEILRIGWGV